ncbi:MAG: hypothetical protein IKK39_02715 [Thermoguttaceae bacterium]|nr:hypothetical protein [Thermoguttaceae bacterium]
MERSFLLLLNSLILIRLATPTLANVKKRQSAAVPDYTRRRSPSQAFCGKMSSE